MRYSNPKLPEGINAGRENPLGEFSLLLLGVGLFVVVVVGVLALAADWLVSQVPFSVEQRAVASVRSVLPAPDPRAEPLQAIADRVVRVMEVDPQIEVTVHFAESDAVNAFATLGGQVVVTSALVEALSSENALAMVVAHEIGHVVRRHPLRALGRAVVVVTALGALAGAGADGLASGIVSDAGGLTLLAYSREQEREADRFALEAVQGLYGHTGGSLELYRELLREASEPRLPALLSTHPETRERIDDMEVLARERGWSLAGEMRPRPEFPAP